MTTRDTPPNKTRRPPAPPAPHRYPDWEKAPHRHYFAPRLPRYYCTYLHTTPLHHVYQDSNVHTYIPTTYAARANGAPGTDVAKDALCLSVS